MVHKYLLKKVRERILTGLILLFIVGPVAFIYIMSQSIEIPVLPAIVQMLRELLVRLILEGRARTGAAISGIGILIIIFGFCVFASNSYFRTHEEEKICQLTYSTYQ